MCPIPSSPHPCNFHTRIRNITAKAKFILKAMFHLKICGQKRHAENCHSPRLWQTFLWVNELTKSTHWRIKKLCTLQSSQTGGYRNKLPRLTVDRVCKTCNPLQWMSYSNAKMAITLINLEQEGPRLTQTLKRNALLTRGGLSWLLSWICQG